MKEMTCTRSSPGALGGFARDHLLFPLQSSRTGWSKRCRGEARDESMSGGVLSLRCSETIERNEHMRLFQQPAK
jgi:hypothetical protein